jgi:hypothetical protein
LIRIALIGATFDNIDFWQQRGERANDGGFACTALAEYQNAPDTWINGGNRQCPFHVVLTDDSGKWIRGTHVCPQ